MISLEYFILLSFYVIYSTNLHRDLDNEWTAYKTKHSLNFVGKEELMRHEIFTINKKIVEEHNGKNSSFKLQLNHLSHLKLNELSKGFKYKKDRPRNYNIDLSKFHEPIRSYVDWREELVVSPVADQGRCGSCYAFCTIGAFESALAINKKIHVILSKQEVIDCSHNYGCAGGYMDNVYDFLIGIGVHNQTQYPYKAIDEKCHLPVRGTTYTIKTYIDVPFGNEYELIRAIDKHGPVSIGIDADHNEFKLYSTGIMDIPKCDTVNLDHGVLAVGYSLESPIPYLIVKNSWGKSWGAEGGYFRIRLFNKNLCGIASQASYPIV